jgi:hypothetical protein
MKKSFLLFIFLFSFIFLNSNKVEAGPYFSSIMSELQPSNDGSTNNFGGMFSSFGRVLAPITNLLNFGKDPFATTPPFQGEARGGYTKTKVTRKNIPPQNNSDNPFISSDPNPYISDNTNNPNTDASSTATTTKTQSLLTTILQKLGIGGNPSSASSTT